MILLNYSLSDKARKTFPFFDGFPMRNNYNGQEAAQSVTDNKGRRWEVQTKVDGGNKGRSKQR